MKTKILESSMLVSPLIRMASRMAVLILMTFPLLIPVACKPEGGSGTAGKGGKTIIQMTGSDTMVNLAQAWSEAYKMVEPSVSIEISGGGSGVGITALINGTTEIANSSRKMEEGEIAKAKAAHGKEARESVVGYDALAIYVHKSNPMEEISFSQLAGIYAENGEITLWEQLKVNNAGCRNGEIILINRHSNSGTFHYFREAILGKRKDFKLGSRDMHGSKDVVELITQTPCAIGYSGMGYVTDGVKMLKVKKKNEDPAYNPNVENTLNGKYPVSRPMYMYTLGEPTPHVKKFLDWVHSDAGQKIVTETGYVPMPKNVPALSTPESGKDKK